MLAFHRRHFSPYYVISVMLMQEYNSRFKLMARAGERKAVHRISTRGHVRRKARPMISNTMPASLPLCRLQGA